MKEMNARERLHAGKLATMEGRHEEALQQFIWFHEHALEEDRALYGVRLSFALAYWKELGDIYPRALRELKRLRDRKAETLLCGAGNRGLFHDVEAINETLSQQVKTYTLFVRLLKVQPELAKACASLALPAIVRIGKFRLAEKLMPDPVDRVTRLGAELNDDIERHADKRRGLRAATRKALIHIFVEDVRHLSSILVARRRFEEAEGIRLLALSSIASPSIRKSVRRMLDSAGQ